MAKQSNNEPAKGPAKGQVKRRVFPFYAIEGQQEVKTCPYLRLPSG